MEIVLATGNKDKAREIRDLFKDMDVKILTKSEKGITFEPEETGDTLHENAEIKARAIYDITGGTVLADDSGIFVRALNWEPGVHSKRFYKIDATDEENNRYLIERLKDKSDKYAEYRAVFALIKDGEIHFFDGKCGGNITDNPKGDNGFGYDPYFIPEGYDKTFGELSIEIKNQISHRARAMQKMFDFLRSEFEER